MVINPCSVVKLSCIRLGQEETLGFAIHATRPIPKGLRISELVGMMPSDNKWPSSDVSRIKPSAAHNQSNRVERVLFGPIRFVNHICAMPNVEVNNVPFGLSHTDMPPSLSPSQTHPRSASKQLATLKPEKNSWWITALDGSRPSLVGVHAERVNPKTSPRSAR